MENLESLSTCSASSKGKRSYQLPHSTAAVYGTCRLRRWLSNVLWAVFQRHGANSSHKTGDFHHLFCYFSPTGQVLAQRSHPPTGRGLYAIRIQSHSNTPHRTHTPWEHATQCLLPRSVLVDHLTILLFLWRPNGGGLAIANALATAG